MGRFAKLEQYTPDEMEFWDRFRACAGRPYTTMRGLVYTFRVQGNELFFDRKHKSITCATVIQAYRKAVELLAEGKPIDGPKKLAVFGSSYLWPVFQDIEVIPKVTSAAKSSKKPRKPRAKTKPKAKAKAKVKAKTPRKRKPRAKKASSRQPLLPLN